MSESNFPNDALNWIKFHQRIAQIFFSPGASLKIVKYFSPNMRNFFFLGNFFDAILKDIPPSKKVSHIVISC